MVKSAVNLSFPIIGESTVSWDETLGLPMRTIVPVFATGPRHPDPLFRQGPATMRPRANVQKSRGPIAPEPGAASMESIPRFSPSRTLITGLAAFAVLALANCGSHEEGDPGDLSARTHLMACGDSLTMEEQADILNGSLILASRHSRDADLNNAFLGRFLAGFILNGVDLEEKDEYGLSFKNKTYRYGKGDFYATVAFVFTKDYGDFSAGDTIPYDLFDLKSYVPRFEVGLSGVDIKEKGPLYHLVDVKWRMAGMVPKFSIRYPDLRTIGISIGSSGSYTHAYPDTATAAEGDSLIDSLTLVMATPVETFFEIEQRFKDKSFVLDYATTEYHSKNFAVDQVFGGSAIRIYEDAKSEWRFDGKYRAELIKNENTYYVEGYLSNHDDNYTKYYCDEERTELMGTAKHHDSLLFGTYHPKSGGWLPYLILAF
jgi:hypothetical protein